MAYLVQYLKDSPSKLKSHEQEEVIQQHYTFVGTEIANFVSGNLGGRGLILNGPKGGGKTSLVNSALKALKADFHIINGTITAPVLWEHIYLYARNKDQILVIDDTDVVFGDIEMADILKAALDGEGKEIHYGKANSAHLRVKNIPSSFKCEGRIIFITNIVMRNLTARRKAIIAPVIDRCEYVQTGLTPEWNSVAIRVFYKHNKIISLNNSELTQAQKDELIEFVCEHSKTDDRWTFRTIAKAAKRMLVSNNWRNQILMSLDTDGQA